MVTIICVALFVLTCCSKSDKRELYLFNWTYYTPDEMITQFEEEFDCEVHLDYYSANEEMFTKLQAGASGYDIVFPSQNFVEIMIKEDMLLELDKSRLPNIKNVNKTILQRLRYDTEMNYAVPYGATTGGIAVNTEMVPEYEKSWSIFEREDLKNKMSMLDDPRETMSATHIYLGHDVNTTDDADLAELEDVLKNKWAPNLVKFDAEGFGKSFAAGNYWVSHGYAEAIFSEVPEDKWDTFDYFIPEEGATLFIDSMCILKGSKHYDLALEFINFVHRPEVYSIFLDYFQFPAILNMEAANYTTKQPMYEVGDISRYQTPLDVGVDFIKYSSIWERVRMDY